MRIARIPTGTGIARLADVPYCQRRDGPPGLVIWGEHPVMPVPVLPRWRDEIGEPVEELKRRELDDAIGPRPGGLSAAAGPDPVGGFVSGQHVADVGDTAGWAAAHGKSLEREWGPCTVPQQVLDPLELELRGYRLSIRRAEAARVILVVP
jgi:hypothetical protein